MDKESELEISPINYYSEEEQENVIVNDFSYNQNLSTKYHTEIKQFAYPKYKRKSKNQDINFLKYIYIGMNVTDRFVDIKEAKNKASEKTSKFIDLPLTKEELDTLQKDSSTEIDDRLKSTIESINTIKKSINKYQKQLNSNDELKDSYNSLFDKQLEVMKYTGNFYCNPLEDKSTKT